MKRVLIVTGTLDYGGIERLVVDTAKALAQHGNYTPTVCNLLGKGALRNELEKFGIKHYSLEFRHYKKDCLKNIFAVRRLIKKCRPDIIHTHQLVANFYICLGALGLNIPIVSHIHNPRGPFSRKIIRFILNRWFITAFIAVIEEKAEELKRLVPAAEDKVFVLHNAIDPQNLVLPKRFNRTDYRAQFQIPGDSFLLGTVGRLVNEKGYDVLLPAFRQILEKIPDSFLILVGDGPERKKLEDLAKNLGVAKNVIFAGYRKDIAALVSMVDICVISSRIESFSLAGLEAMYLGTPVIMTDKVVSRNIFLSASFVVPFSSDGLANGVVSLHKDEKQKEKIIAAGKNLVSRFTIDSYVKNLEAAYDTILNK